ncbi:MAG TPA: branched-chain amino acid ABC transporter substrate-binding protein [Anaerolineaceae bacterium]|nr:branched-chain amino acid ABC transporter substrate-binding protein [Anaerolineaceae bacterium]
MSKKLVLVFLALLIAVSVVGCSAAKPAEKQTVKIGFIGPLSGGGAAVGIGAKNSFQLKVDEVLADGTYPYNIEVVYEDDASDPATGVAAATKIASDPDVVAAATHWNSPVGLATVDVFHKYGMAQVFWGTIHRDIIFGNDYKEPVRVIPTSEQSMELAAEYAVKFDRMEWVIINDTTDYGTKIRDEFTASMEKRGGTILEAIGVTVGQQDFSAVLSRVKELDPEGIFYAGVTTEAAGVRMQAVKMGITEPIFMGPPGIQSDTFGEITLADAEGTFCSGTFDVNSTEEGKAFVEAYNAKYTEPFEQNGPYAYDSAAIILEALKAVGPDRAKIVDYILEHQFKGVIGDIQWDEYGQNGVGGLTMYVNQDQKWVKYEESEYASGVRTFPWAN